MERGEAHALGLAGEAAAALYLEERGYRIRARRYSNARGYRLGEIDIIAEKEGIIRFVEVKTTRFRSGASRPVERIDRKKLRCLVRLAELYLAEFSLQEAPFGFDAVSVMIGEQPEDPAIEYLEDIFY